MVRWGVAAAGILVLLLIVGGVLFDRVITPNQTLASVGGTAISRQDYWKARANDLYEQALQFQDFAQFVGPDQQGQYVAMAQQSLAQIPEVWGSRDVDPGTLQTMIDNQLYLQGLDDLGLSISPEEIETFALNRFAPPDAPLIPPSPTPTLTAERAAMATSTAAALLATPIASPVATPLAGSPVPGAATPVANGSAATPFAAATPNPADARATAEAEFALFQAQFFPQANLSRDDYERLVAAPALARQKVRDALAATVGQSAPQVRASHILVPTQEEADAARARIVEGGEDFETVAAEVSTDEGTAVNGGDLGWFTREEMVAPFAAAAFSLAPGEVSAPVESEFGWHVIRVEETDPERPLTDRQINRLQQAAVDRWLDEQRAAVSITSSLPPTPTPAAQEFTPPVGAPPPPLPTPLPPATPVGGAPEPVLVPATPEG
jgi:peptidyl-prolyl cis-trans isomerase C